MTINFVSISMKKTFISILITLGVIAAVFLYLASNNKSSTTLIEKLSLRVLVEKTTSQGAVLLDYNKQPLPDKKADIELKTPTIKQCDAETFTIDDPEVVKKLSETENMLDVFRDSQKANSQLAFSILDFNNSPIQLEELIEKEPDNKLAQILYYSKCSIAPKTSGCFTKSFNSITLDTDNGALWLHLANTAAAKTDLEEFTSALKNTISAPTFNEYRAETIYLFDQALLENGFTEKISRRTLATIMSTAQTSDLSKLTIYCRDISSLRSDVAQLCIDAGVRIASQAKSIMSESIGYSLQIVGFEALGDFEQAESLRKVKKQIYPISSHDNAVSNLILFDEELLDYWFNNLKVHGEKKSNQLLIEEAIRLSSDPDYNPCPG